MSALSKLTLTPYQDLSPISEQIYAALKEAVLSGALPAGEHFTDTLVANHFSISRTPAREGLLRLEREGFLSSVSRKGFVVPDVRAQDARELYTVALALEPAAVRLAAQARTEEDLACLKEILDQEDRSVSSAADTNFTFHVRLAQASGNQLMWDYIRQVREKMKLLHSFHDQAGSYPSTQAFLTRSKASHQQIYDAVAAGDGELAELYLRRHLLIAQEHFLHAVT